MKLRNRKTGEIVELDHFSMHYNRPEEWGQQPCSTWNHSLAELNEEWEDVEDTNAPNMPLIEDEAKRNVFKAWAEILGRDLEKADFKYDAERNSFNCYIADSTIEFANGEGINCVDREIYTFRALCGEEEE